MYVRVVNLSNHVHTLFVNLVLNGVCVCVCVLSFDSNLHIVTKLKRISNYKSKRHE